MNKVAFITGASRGIGREAALAFARAGFDVAISARTLNEGEQHEHALRNADGAPLAGSLNGTCLLYTSPSPRDRQKSRMPSSA